MVAVTGEPIDPAALLERISSAESGGTDVFVGRVRNQTGGKKVRKLEYSVYLPMAEKLMAQIENEIREKWEVHDVVMVHRIGSLSVGEVAVVTAVSAVHRKEAFEACRYAIDQIKSAVPIWKREILEDGVRWGNEEAM